MPFYRFDIESPLSAPKALERIRGLVRDKPGFWQSLTGPFVSRLDATPFVGTVQGDTFTMYRDIRYRNSFLPRIWGQVEAAPGGTRIHVVMSLHPWVAAFVIFFMGFSWFGDFNEVIAQPAGIPISFAVAASIFVVAMTLGGFIPEAIIARRILKQSLGSAGA